MLVECGLGVWLVPSDVRGFERPKTVRRPLSAHYGVPLDGGQEPTSEAKAHLHHAFFENAGTPGAERLIVFPPKQRLSQARRGQGAHGLQREESTATGVAFWAFARKELPGDQLVENALDNGQCPIGPEDG